MDALAGEWVQVLAYPNRTGTGPPRRVLAGWLRERGIDYEFSLAPDEIRVDTMRGRRPDGSAGCDVSIAIRGAALRRLGLHPSQETSRTSRPRE